MATRLERSYFLPEGKTISGMATAVGAYFEKFSGMDVHVNQMNTASYQITCRTKSVHRTIRGNLKRAAGHDMNLTVGLFQQANHVKVEFDQEISEGLRMAKALLTAPLGIGLIELHGIYQRHNIPFELDEVISAYLGQ